MYRSGLFSFGNVDVASNLFNVIASIDEAINKLFSRFQSGSFAPKESNTIHTAGIFLLRTTGGITSIEFVEIYFLSAAKESSKESCACYDASCVMRQAERPTSMSAVFSCAIVTGDFRLAGTIYNLLK